MLELPGGDVERVDAWFGARAGWPGVTDLAAEAAWAVVVDLQIHIHRLAKPGRAVR
jgi:hypothetical protein